MSGLVPPAPGAHPQPHPAGATLPDIGPSRVLDRGQVQAEPGLSLFQKVLLVTDGSVTELLCLYTGQPIRARKLGQFEQRAAAGEAPAALECRSASLLLHRRILLVDAHAAHLYAESVFIVERLSPRTREGLLGTDTPIGVLWREERSEMYREIVDLRVERDAAIAAHFGEPPGAALLSRSYLLRQHGLPFGMITEKFPATRFRR